MDRDYQSILSIKNYILLVYTNDRKPKLASGSQRHYFVSELGSDRWQARGGLKYILNLDQSGYEKLYFMATDLDNYYQSIT